MPLCRDRNISGAGTILICSAVDLNLECINGWGNLKRAVIAVVLGNLDFYIFEGTHFSLKCCCFSGALIEVSSAGSCSHFPGSDGD